VNYALELNYDIGIRSIQGGSYDWQGDCEDGNQCNEKSKHGLAEAKVLPPVLI
jgi:L-ribulose-5-phosphate 3-epimerase UlaE